MKPILSLLLSALFLGSAAVATAMTADAVFDDSSSWPYRIALTEPFETESRTLPAGTTAVLIRLESPQRALVDFGRNGLHRIPVDATNITQQASAIDKGEVAKDFPNYVQTIGPRLVDVTIDPINKFRFEDVVDQEYFITIYADGDMDTLVTLAEAVEAQQSTLEQTQTLAFIIPQETMHDFDYAERMRAAGLKIPFMYGHLAMPYTRVLDHGAKAFPTMVLTDANGKILALTTPSTGTVADQLATIVKGLL